MQPTVVAGMASTAGLLAGSAIVCVGPPFDASESRRGSTLEKELFAEENPQEVPLSRLYSLSVIGATWSQLDPPKPSATMDMLNVIVELV